MSDEEAQHSSEGEGGVEKKETKSKATQRHKMEIREFKKTQERMLQQTPKKDKKARAELEERLKQMEADMKKRHEAELKSFDAQESLATQTAKISLAPSNVISKSQAKKNKKEQRAHEKMKAIDEANKDVVSDRKIEIDGLKVKLAPLQMTIKEITPDGNCLYSAIADQLPIYGHQAFPDHARVLRNCAADYMIKHPDDFIPFLPTENASLADLKKYCDELRNTNNWGGQLEIQALCNALALPITIHTANAPDIVMGDPFLKTNKSLHLAYHKHAYALGEHYNSVVPIVESEEAEEDAE
eukprot:Phypoly_transcript_06579.p1 GENE.Phypoly_transcript_06579~~Phypoly_transcript_06579.p1  ORF type:complete len:299 (-),score=51.26 Phypoly_transcript_06579:120-1016(-)